MSLTTEIANREMATKGYFILADTFGLLHVGEITRIMGKDKADEKAEEVGSCLVIGEATEADVEEHKIEMAKVGIETSQWRDVDKFWRAVAE